MKTCHQCRREWPGVSDPGSRSVCEGCGEDLHVCLNCRHYEAGRPNECREPESDTVIDKSRGNFCDYFQFRDGSPATGGKGNASSGDNPAVSRFKDLFNPGRGDKP